jgi:gamma-glutamyl-gamma-aminobutyrate hydrolase PuuD
VYINYIILRVNYHTHIVKLPNYYKKVWLQFLTITLLAVFAQTAVADLTWDEKIKTNECATAIIQGNLEILKSNPLCSVNQPFWQVIELGTGANPRISRETTLMAVWFDAVKEKPVNPAMMAVLDWLIDQGAEFGFRDIDGDLGDSSDLALPYLLKIYERIPKEIVGHPGEEISLQLWQDFLSIWERIVTYYAKGLDGVEFPLHAALLNSDISALSAALKAGASLNQPDAIGNTPIHLAVFMYNKEAIALLIKEGADLTTRSSDDGSTLLHRFIKCSGFAEFVSFVEEQGVSYLEKDQFLGATALHYCDWETGYDHSMDDLSVSEAKIQPCVITPQLATCLRWIQQGGLVDIEVPFLGTVTDQLYGAEDPMLREWSLMRTDDPTYTLCRSVREKEVSLASRIPEGQKAIGIVRHNGLVLGALEVHTRKLHKKNPDLFFYIIEPEMLEQEPELMERFCGFILPGSPEGHSMKYEEAVKGGVMKAPRVKAYLQVLDHAAKHRLPVLGICGGNQFMGLWHKGDGTTPADQTDKAESVVFEPGNLLYWMMLTDEEKDAVIERCEMPEISFPVTRMHHNAIDANNPGEGLTIAAKSRLGTVLSVTDNVRALGVQFHPEMVAYSMNENEEADLRHAQIFENFVQMSARAYEVKKDMLSEDGSDFDYDAFEEAVYGSNKAALEKMRVCRLNYTNSQLKTYKARGGMPIKPR